MIPGGKSTKMKLEMLRGINLAVSMKMGATDPWR